MQLNATSHSMAVFSQVTHKLLLRALASLKSGVSSGSGEGGDGMVTALLAMASFCDRQLRLSEDDDDGE